MKITKHKNILGLLYGLLLLIPFASVLVRTSYVSMNKNAKDSYYGETINESITNPIDYTDLVPYHRYTFNNPINEEYSTSFNTGSYMLVQNLVFENLSYEGVIKIQFYLTSNYNALQFYNANNVQVYQYNMRNSSVVFHFDYIAFNGQSGILAFYNYFYETTNNKYSYLDNAFEYSLYEITDNDIGKVKFFTWFADMFLDVNDGTSAIYIGFINWYFNYALLISLGYVLFGVLMWFINWVRRMIEKGQDFGQGGF